MSPVMGVERPHVFKGTLAEAFALLQAIDHHCTCRDQVSDVRPTSGVKLCSSCSWLKETQRTIDRLLYERHRADVLQRQEWCLPMKSADEAAMLPLERGDGIRGAVRPSALSADSAPPRSTANPLMLPDALPV